MFICPECGALFEEPKIYYEHHPYGMGYADEKWAVCPECGEAGFEKAKWCKCCGEWVEKLTDGLCAECHKEYEEEEEE